MKLLLRLGLAAAIAAATVARTPLVCFYISGRTHMSVERVACGRFNGLLLGPVPLQSLQHPHHFFICV